MPSQKDVINQDARKKELRHVFRQKRTLFSKTSGQQATASMNKRLLSFLAQHRSAIIAGYYPIHDEISGLPSLLEIAELQNTKLALPVVRGAGQPLLFRQWHEKDRLQNGAFNIAEPTDSAAALIPDLVIVPLLSFDSKGFRLGYGGGFYDRTLATLRAKNADLLAVGIGCEVQYSPDLLPTDRFDQALDYMVTDEKLWNFG